MYGLDVVGVRPAQTIQKSWCWTGDCSGFQTLPTGCFDGGPLVGGVERHPHAGGCHCPSRAQKWPSGRVFRLGVNTFMSG